MQDQNTTTLTQPIHIQTIAIPGIIDPLLRRSHVLLATGLSSSALDRLERSGEFPQKVQLGLRSVGWPASEVNDWIDARKAERSARTAA